VLDKVPKEREWVSWLYVGSCSLAVFLTVPFARAVQSIVSESIGSHYFVVFVAAALGATAIGMVMAMRRRSAPVNAYVILIIIAGIFVAYLYTLRRSPEETIHLLEFALLAALVYRACLHRNRDTSIYIITALIVGIIGIVDETIQWLTPERVWALSDIRLNFTAGVLALLAIGLGLRPGLVAGRPGRAGLRQSSYVAALAVALLGISLLNTPERIKRYAAQLPALAYLVENQRVMIEYGYLYRDPDIGVFRSRFTLEELRQADKSRGAATARVLTTLTDEEGVNAFRERYTAFSDRYIHEAGIHLFRRNRYTARGSKPNIDDGTRRWAYTIAVRENRILEKYYPSALRLSEQNWTPAQKASMEEIEDGGQAYESPVSIDVVTRYTQRQVLWVFTTAGIGLLICGYYLGRRPAPKAEGE
jgi:hypothetical protein